MNVGEYCKRAVISIKSSADVLEAAKLMRQEHVGFLVAYKADDELRRPMGVITDRDLVLAVMARDVGPQTVTVEEVMTRQPLVAAENDELSDLLHAMRTAGIRRVPVVDGRGALTGIIAIDDVIEVITALMCDITLSIKGEQRQEWRIRTG